MSEGNKNAKIEIRNCVGEKEYILFCCDFDA